MDNNVELKADVSKVVETKTEVQPSVDYEKLYRESLANQEKERKYAQDMKAKYQERLTEEEKQKAMIEERENHYKAIERENKLIKIKSELSKSINDEKYLDTLTSKLIDGDITGAVEQFNTYLLNEREVYEKQIKEKKLITNPIPPAGSTPSAKSWKDYTMVELNKLQAENPTEYKRILSQIK